MLRRFAAVAAALALSSPAFAYHSRECWKTVVAPAKFGPYQYKYSTWDFISSKTSSEEGCSKVSSASSTQESTMAFDPGVTTTGASQSQTEFTSSKGNCDAWAGLLNRREQFVAANLDGVKRDLAYGGGRLADSLAHLSGCDGALSARFAAAMQSHYAELSSVDNVSSPFTEAVDRIIDGDADLRAACLSVRI
jgi:hypothetical protein